MRSPTWPESMPTTALTLQIPLQLLLDQTAPDFFGA